MRVFVLVTVLSILSACGRKRENDARPSPEPAVQRSAGEPATSSLVPSAYPLQADVPMSGTFPEITGADRLIEATNFILALEGSSRFTQPEDRMIFSFLHEYMEGRRKFRYHILASGMKDTDGHSAIAGYRCDANIYGIKAGIRPSTLALAIVLYHEVGHAVLCESLITAENLSRAEAQRQMQAAGTCLEEYISWGAQVRLFSAVLDRGDSRDVLSATEDLDLMVLGTTLHAWQALATNRFCAWYDQMRR